MVFVAVVVVDRNGEGVGLSQVDPGPGTRWLTTSGIANKLTCTGDGVPR